jgi:putative transposase
VDPALPNDQESLCGSRDWPHAPPHRLGQAGTYFVTARLLDSTDHFTTAERLDFVQSHLRELAKKYGWTLEAWAVLSNHYHFIGHSPKNEGSAESLRKFLTHFHSDVTRHINALDGIPGRKLWHNFRDTCLTFQQSYLARLNYTHQNAVHHGLVRRAEDYPWCSAKEFQKACTPAWVKTVQSFRFDAIARSDGE